jgi:hypothetical protein
MMSRIKNKTMYLTKTREGRKEGENRVNFTARVRKCRDGPVAESDSAFLAFLDEAIYERDELFSAARKNEGRRRGIPVKLEAGGKRRDPELAHGSVGSDHELSRRGLKQDIQDAVLLLDFKAGVFFLFTLNEMPLQGVEGGLGQAAELLFIDHGPSVARRTRKVFIAESTVHAPAGILTVRICREQQRGERA